MALLNGLFRWGLRNHEGHLWLRLAVEATSEDMARVILQRGVRLVRGVGENVPVHLRITDPAIRVVSFAPRLADERALESLNEMLWEVTSTPDVRLEYVRGACPC
jgi:hypothetical protein